jgi:hypothetical protein
LHTGGGSNNGWYEERSRIVEMFKTVGIKNDKSCRYYLREIDDNEHFNSEGGEILIFEESCPPNMKEKKEIKINGDDIHHFRIKEDIPILTHS